MKSFIAGAFKRFTADFGEDILLLHNAIHRRNVPAFTAPNE
jgi:hypothetical protein